MKMGKSDHEERSATLPAPREAEVFRRSEDKIPTSLWRIKDTVILSLRA